MQSKFDLNSGIAVELSKICDSESLKNANLVCKSWHEFFKESVWHKRLEGLTNYIPKNHKPKDVCYIIQNLRSYELKECTLFPLESYLQFNDFELAKCLLSSSILEKKIDELMLLTAIIMHPSLLKTIKQSLCLSKEICTILFSKYANTKKYLSGENLNYIRDHLMWVYQSNDLLEIALSTGNSSNFPNSFYVYKNKFQQDVQTNTTDQSKTSFDINQAYTIYQAINNEAQVLLSVAATKVLW